jgi:hypothetical protein
MATPRPRGNGNPAIQPPPIETEEGFPIERLVIPAPRMATREFLLEGVTPYVSNNFSKEAQDQMAADQKKGSQTKKGKQRQPKDFDRDYRESMHISEQGWHGHPASTFRAAMIDACRTVGYKMTHAKMALFILADGYDVNDGRPLVKIEGKPEKFTTFVRLANGAPDIKTRGRWNTWSIKLRVEFDLDMFSADDVGNLLQRVGRQVGIGAGRPFSKTSCGQDWGRFELRGAPTPKHSVAQKSRQSEA